MAHRATKDLVKALERDGYVVTLRKSGHYRVSHPDRRGLVFLPATPSDPRSFKNTLADLNRVFKWRP